MTPSISWPQLPLRPRLMIAAMIGIWGAAVAGATLPWIVTDPYDPPISYDLVHLIQICAFSAGVGFVLAFLAGLLWAPHFGLHGGKGRILASFAGVGATVSAMFLVSLVSAPEDWSLVILYGTEEILRSPAALLIWVCGLVAVRRGARAIAPST